MSLKQFIEDSLCSTTRDKTYTIHINKEACAIIKNKTNLNILDYKFIINEEYIRHIRNGHKEDLYLLEKLPEILNFFSNVEKSITKARRTRKNEVSLVFKKTLEDGTVKMVALKISNKKILSLRTFFRP